MPSQNDKGGLSFQVALDIVQIEQDIATINGKIADLQSKLSAEPLKVPVVPDFNFAKLEEIKQDIKTSAPAQMGVEPVLIPAKLQELKDLISKEPFTIKIVPDTESETLPKLPAKSATITFKITTKGGMAELRELSKAIDNWTNESQTRLLRFRVWLEQDSLNEQLNKLPKERSVSIEPILLPSGVSKLEETFKALKPFKVTVETDGENAKNPNSKGIVKNPKVSFELDVSQAQAQIEQVYGGIKEIIMFIDAINKEGIKLDVDLNAETILSKLETVKSSIESLQLAANIKTQLDPDSESKLNEKINSLNATINVLTSIAPSEIEKLKEQISSISAPINVTPMLAGNSEKTDKTSSADVDTSGAISKIIDLVAKAKAALAELEAQNVKVSVSTKWSGKTAFDGIKKIEAKSIEVPTTAMLLPNAEETLQTNLDALNLKVNVQPIFTNNSASKESSTGTDKLKDKLGEVQNQGTQIPIGFDTRNALAGLQNIESRIEQLKERVQSVSPFVTFDARISPASMNKIISEILAYEQPTPYYLKAELDPASKTKIQSDLKEGNYTVQVTAQLAEKIKDANNKNVNLQLTVDGDEATTKIQSLSDFVTKIRNKVRAPFKLNAVINQDTSKFDIEQRLEALKNTEHTIVFKTGAEEKSLQEVIELIKTLPLQAYATIHADVEKVQEELNAKKPTLFVIPMPDTQAVAELVSAIERTTAYVNVIAKPVSTTDKSGEPASQGSILDFSALESGFAKASKSIEALKKEAKDAKIKISVEVNVPTKENLKTIKAAVQDVKPDVKTHVYVTKKELATLKNVIKNFNYEAPVRPVLGEVNTEKLDTFIKNYSGKEIPITINLNYTETKNGTKGKPLDKEASLDINTSKLDRALENAASKVEALKDIISKTPLKLVVSATVSDESKKTLKETIKAINPIMTVFARLDTKSLDDIVKTVSTNQKAILNVTAKPTSTKLDKNKEDTLKSLVSFDATEANKTLEILQKKILSIKNLIGKTSNIVMSIKPKLEGGWRSELVKIIKNAAPIGVMVKPALVSGFIKIIKDKLNAFTYPVVVTPVVNKSSKTPIESQLKSMNVSFSLLPTVDATSAIEKIKEAKDTIKDEEYFLKINYDKSSLSAMVQSIKAALKQYTFKIDLQAGSILGATPKVGGGVATPTTSTPQATTALLNVANALKNATPTQAQATAQTASAQQLSKAIQTNTNIQNNVQSTNVAGSTQTTNVQGNTQTWNSYINSLGSQNFSIPAQKSSAAQVEKFDFQSLNKLMQSGSRLNDISEKISFDLIVSGLRSTSAQLTPIAQSYAKQQQLNKTITDLGGDKDIPLDPYMFGRVFKQVDMLQQMGLTSPQTTPFKFTGLPANGIWQQPATYNVGSGDFSELLSAFYRQLKSTQGITEQSKPGLTPIRNVQDQNSFIYQSAANAVSRLRSLPPEQLQGFDVIRQYLNKPDSNSFLGNITTAFKAANANAAANSINSSTTIKSYLSDVFGNLKTIKAAQADITPKAPTSMSDIYSMFMMSASISRLAQKISSIFDEAASKFDQVAMSFRKTEIVSGMSSTQFTNYKEDLYSMSGRTMTDIGTLAEMGYSFATRGYMNPETAISVLEPLTISSLITGETPVTMGQSILSLMQAWNPDKLSSLEIKAPGLVQRYSDLMTYAYSNSPLEVRWFKDIANYAAPTFAGHGFDPTETIATFMAMSQMIPTAGIGARSSRMAVSNLLDYDRLALTSEKYDINLDSMISEARKSGQGLAGVLEALFAEVQTLPEEKRTGFLRDIGGGVRGAMALMALMPVIPNIKDYIGDINTEAAGSTSKAQAEFMATPLGRLKNAEAAISSEMYKIGEKTADARVALENFKLSLLRVFESLPQPAMNFLYGAGQGAEVGAQATQTFADLAIMKVISQNATGGAKLFSNIGLGVTIASTIAAGLISAVGATIAEGKSEYAQDLNTRISGATASEALKTFTSQQNENDPYWYLRNEEGKVPYGTAMVETWREISAKSAESRPNDLFESLGQAFGAGFEGLFGVWFEAGKKTTAAGMYEGTPAQSLSKEQVNVFVQQQVSTVPNDLQTYLTNERRVQKKSDLEEFDIRAKVTTSFSEIAVKSTFENLRDSVFETLSPVLTPEILERTASYSPEERKETLAHYYDKESSAKVISAFDALESFLSGYGLSSMPINAIVPYALANKKEEVRSTLDLYQKEKFPDYFSGLISTIAAGDFSENALDKLQLLIPKDAYADVMKAYESGDKGEFRLELDRALEKQTLGTVLETFFPGSTDTLMALIQDATNQIVEGELSIAEAIEQLDDNKTPDSTDTYEGILNMWLQGMLNGLPGNMLPGFGMTSDAYKTWEPGNYADTVSLNFGRLDQAAVMLMQSAMMDKASTPTFV